MVWTIAAEPYGSTLPGAVRLTITGDPSAPVVVMRRDKNGTYPVRQDIVLSASGIAQVIDPEPAFGSVTYSLPTGETATTTVPALPSGKALLRSLVVPYVGWVEVVWSNETGVTWPTSSTVFPIIGSGNPVVIADVRRERSGVMVFAAADAAGADAIIQLLHDGAAFLLRSCAAAAGKVRDTYFYALDAREERLGNGRIRLVTVDYQAVDRVLGVTTTPAGAVWFYQDLADQTTAPTYAAVRSARSNYLQLATDPLA